jgi:hypothetical protein
LAARSSVLSTCLSTESTGVGFVGVYGLKFFPATAGGSVLFRTTTPPSHGRC